MTRKETTSIALKCYAIYIIIQLIITIPSFASLGYQLTVYSDGAQSGIWMIILPIVSVLAGVVAVVLLWKFTNALLLKETTPDESCNDISSTEIMKIVLACMGVYFFIHAALSIPYSFVDFQVVRKAENYNISLHVMNLVTEVLELAFGCLLIAKPAKWTKMILSIEKE